MAPLRSVILLAVCFAAAGDRTRSAWEQLYEQAQSRLERAQFEAARAAAGAGYHAWRGSPDAGWNWRFRLALADADIGLDRMEEVQALLGRAAPAAEFEAHRQVGLAYVKYRAHDFAAAQRCLGVARELTPQARRDLLGKIDLIGGTIHLKQERLAAAEASFRHALEVVGGSRSLEEVYTLIDLGVVNRHGFRYDEAVLWFDRARRLAEQLGIQSAIGMALGNLGESYLELGDFDRALTLLDRAVKLADRVYQPGWLSTMGDLWHYLQNDKKAAEFYERARALAHPGGDEYWLVDILDNLAELSRVRGDIPSATRLNSEASRIAAGLPPGRVRIGPHLEAAEIQRAQRRPPAAEAHYREAITLSSEVGDPILLWRSYAGLASLDAESGRIGAARRHYRLAISTIEAQRTRLEHDQSKFTFLSHLIRFYRDYVDFLVERGDQAGAFRVAESCRARVLAEKLHQEGYGATAADPRVLRSEARRTGTVFLSYWLAPRRSFLWVIDSAGLHQFTLPAELEIAENVRRYTSAVLNGRDPLATGNAAGRWLYSNLIGAHYRVAPATQVVIVPDGSLHELNFESLPDQANRYWIYDATVSIAPSLALLRRAQRRGGERLLLIGDPTLDANEFAPLTNVRSEVEAVSRRFPEREVLTGSAASPAAYQQAHAERYSVLHFATHAVANRQSPLDSAILLSGTEGNRKLYARDILLHPLRADLVTLSACQTAGNRAYYGEGLTGLAWAFLSAGARNIVATLWEVDDRATAQLMGDFYQALTPGGSPASALREAKLRLLASAGAYRKPLYWAAFETFSRTLDAPPEGARTISFRPRTIGAAGGRP